MFSKINNNTNKTEEIYIKKDLVIQLINLVDKYKKEADKYKVTPSPGYIKPVSSMGNGSKKDDNEFSSIKDPIVKEILKCNPIDPYAKDLYNDKMLDISDIVDTILTGKFTTDVVGLTVDDTEKSRYLSFEGGENRMTFFTDLQREFKDIMTELITNEFLKTQDVMVEFISIIYDIIDRAITQYKQKKGLSPKDIVFIYKGGNALKSIYLKYLNEVPGIVGDSIYNAFNKYFKRSDADFQIYINPKLPIWETVYHDMKLLSYLTINRIRNLFLVDPEKYFDFYKYDKEYRQNILSKHLNNLNNSNIIKSDIFTKGLDTLTPEDYKNIQENKYLHNMEFLKLRFKDITVNAPGAENIDFHDRDVNNELIDDERIKNIYGTYIDQFFRYDLIITKHPTDKNQFIIYKFPPLQEKGNKNNRIPELKYDVELNEKIYSRLPTPQSEFYISINDTPEYTDGKFKSKFTLVRMKMNFTAFVRSVDGKYGLMNIPGEVIDISIPHRDATEMYQFYDSIDDYITEYNYVGKFGLDKVFKFKGYTLKYFIKDLNKMLFRERKYPWLAEKYEKRIYRVLFLYIIDMFINVPNKDLQLSIQQLKQAFTDALNSTNSNKNQVRRQFENIILTQPKYNHILIQFYINKMIQILGGPTPEGEDPDMKYDDLNLEDNDVKKFFQINIDVLNDTEKLFALLNDFIQNEGKVQYNRLLTINEI